MTENGLRAGVLALLRPQADEAYRRFQTKLIPGARPILGVRMPALRRVAACLAGRRDGASPLFGRFPEYLDAAPDGFCEEQLLGALLLGMAPLSADALCARLDAFLPRIGDWAVCDTLCGAVCRPAGRCPGFFERIAGYLSSAHPWTVRAGLVLMLHLYVDDDHLPAVLERCGNIRSDHLYVRLAQAWLVAECLALCPGKTLAWLRTDPLDDWTTRRAVRKARESFRVANAVKAALPPARPRGKRGG